MENVNLTLIPYNEQQLKPMFKQWVKEVLQEVLSEIPQKNTTNEQDEIDIHEYARITGRKVSTVYGDVHAGRINHFKRGRLLRFSRQEALQSKKLIRSASAIDEAASNYIVNKK